MVSLTANVSLAPRTTFRIGGLARFFAEIEDEDDLLEALAFAESEHLPTFILGGGSNLLIPDAGFPGLVLHLAISGAIERHANIIHASAGTDWNRLVLHLCEEGINGMECLAGIPGLVGACPIQNIGAYGQEVSQVIHSVRAYDRVQRNFVTLSKEDCRFAYRQSIFNTTHLNRYIITQISFRIDPQATPNLAYPDLRTYFASRAKLPTSLEVYEAVRSIRQSKGMLLIPNGAPGGEDTHSAGSFFKNPIVSLSALNPIAVALNISESAIPRYPAPDGQIKLSAAWLLDQAGFHKAHIDGQAGISSRHSLALINRGQATYADIARLRDRIVRTVQSRFHLTLEQEPVEPRVQSESQLRDEATRAGVSVRPAAPSPAGLDR